MHRLSLKTNLLFLSETFGNPKEKCFLCTHEKSISAGKPNQENESLL
jgi:hypothetical protein